jgi:general secretion pathway protein D
MTPHLFRTHARRLLVAGLFLLSAGGAWAQNQGQGGGRGGIVTGGNFTGGGGGGGAAGSSSANGTRQYTNSTLMGDAVITSDMDSRRLIVITDDATNENIRTVIAGLDKPKPQVLINVVFLQVQHDQDLDLGAEIGQKNGRIAIATNPSGNATSNFGLTAGGLTASSGLAATTATGAIAAQTSPYGLYYSIAGRDVNVMIHALASTNKTEILSRPSILTRSGQQAMIMVGQTVPLTTGSRQDATSGATFATISYQDIGIILRVTPFITTEGMVEMIVTPEISSLSQTTVNIGPGTTAPVIDKRSADTVVVTPSDQTVVIGGLISTQNIEGESKVPLLGDIPLLGYAFKYKTKAKTKTELLIFLTPHVVKRPEDLGQLAQAEQAKLELAPKTFEKDEMNKFVGGH